MIRIPIGLGIMLLAGLAIAEGRAISDPVIGPRDVLEISVYDEPELSRTVVVSSSGQFSYPLLKRVDATGKTLDELGQHMEQRLIDEGFLVEPSVNVLFKEQNNAVAILSGAVKEPGIISIYPGISLREVIAKQGGIDTDKAGPFIHVQRLEGSTQQINREELLSATASISSPWNISIQSGDEIVVPEANFFYVHGAVKTPGGYPITRLTTLEEAIGMAGGRLQQAGDTMLWHHNINDASSRLITFTYKQFEQEIRIRKSRINRGDSIHIPQDDFVFVGGEVASPGMIAWEPGMTLLQAIIAAGDRTFVASNKITVVRADEKGLPVKKSYSFSDIKKNKDSNIEILPGDAIRVGQGLLNIPYTIRRINPFSLPLDLFGPVDFF